MKKALVKFMIELLVRHWNEQTKVRGSNETHTVVIYDILDKQSDEKFTRIDIFPRKSIIE